jgi:uncharacterized membrane protein
MSADAISAARSDTRGAPPWDLVLLGLTALSLALIPVHIDRAFGLPAHPLLLHVPVVLVPIAGLAALAFVARSAWLDRYGLALGALAVATTAATILTVGAGQALRADRSQGGGPGGDEASRLAEHAEAGENLRLVVIAFTVALLLTLLARRLRGRGAIDLVLRGAVAVLAVAAIFFVIRTGHLGAQLTWEQQGGPPGVGGPGPG